MWLVKFREENDLFAVILRSDQRIRVILLCVVPASKRSSYEGCASRFERGFKRHKDIWCVIQEVKISIQSFSVTNWFWHRSLEIFLWNESCLDLWQAFKNERNKTGIMQVYLVSARAYRWELSQQSRPRKVRHDLPHLACTFVCDTNGSKLRKQHPRSSESTHENILLSSAMTMGSTSRKPYQDVSKKSREQIQRITISTPQNKKSLYYKTWLAFGEGQIKMFLTAVSYPNRHTLSLTARCPGAYITLFEYRPPCNKSR